ncbi:PRC-barrel domain-containing protein [Pseudoroseomonas cervicalis]|uniref:PRC-barrel domain-containing protein n=1 Tax=Teichococcus cervicalis TaxID=204525 RepID=UPI0027872A80|nr:PRC-barrel domain-containing protein [Pseudoroseomonas cervicalis]MDQ1080299.1 sporulation protein YlmC with PRC-barrel domain [Pseudoroseomonas cervicalis]
MTPRPTLPLLAALALLGTGPAWAQAPNPGAAPAPAPGQNAPNQNGQAPATGGQDQPLGQNPNQPQDPARGPQPPGPQTEGPGTRAHPEASVAPSDLQGRAQGGTGAPLPPGATVSLDADRWRASRLLGAEVFNSENRSLGKVEDLLFTRKGGLAVIVGVGGFLGMGQRLVSLPYDRLQYSERWVLPGATEATLKDMPEFRFEQEQPPAPPR